MAPRPEYFKLTPTGFSLLYGPDAPIPTKRHFAEVGIAHQHHTKALADFIVHTEVAAHAAGFNLRNFFRENALRLDVDGEALFPDCAFELSDGAGRQFNLVVELDCGTERVRSPKDIDSWQRKIRLYDRLQDRNVPSRFRVLVVCTRDGGRLAHILNAAAGLLRNPQRSLLYGTALDTYLRGGDVIYRPYFRDHYGNAVALVPSVPESNSAYIRRQRKASLVPGSRPLALY